MPKNFVTTGYLFTELPCEEARQNAKEWYLEADLDNGFNDYLEEKLSNLFPGDHIRYQYSLANCQGDGLNLYGCISVNNLVHKQYFKQHFTLQELDKIQEIANLIVDPICIPENKTRYTYCYANHIDFANDWSSALDEEDVPTIGQRTLQSLIAQFETVCKEYFIRLCEEYETLGYRMIYEPWKDQEQDFADMMDDNGWYFNQNGRRIGYYDYMEDC